jgi:hypothetical protein
MSDTKRLNIDIDPDFKREVKRTAAEHDLTVRRLTCDALAHYIKEVLGK